MSKCIILIASAKISVGKKMQFQPVQNKTFSNTPPPTTNRQLKHPQRTKINKMLSSFLSLVFRTKFTTSILKSKQVFHPKDDWTRTSSIGVLN